MGCSKSTWDNSQRHNFQWKLKPPRYHHHQCFLKKDNQQKRNLQCEWSTLVAVEVSKKNSPRCAVKFWEDDSRCYYDDYDGDTWAYLLKHSCQKWNLLNFRGMNPCFYPRPTCKKTEKNLRDFSGNIHHEKSVHKSKNLELNTSQMSQWHVDSGQISEVSTASLNLQMLSAKK